MLNKKLYYFLVALIYLSISLVLFWPAAISPANVVTGGVPNSLFAGTGDVYQNLWTLWWVNYAIFSLHQSPYYTNLLFAPYGADLVTETLSPLAAIFSFPFQAVSLGLGYNAIFFLDFALCGLFMFWLADYIVKNKYAAFLAGIVFAFSPFHITHAGVGHLNWDSIQFLPLFILLFLKIAEENKILHVFLASVAFVFLIFFGDPQQGIIAIAFLILLLLAWLLDPKTKEKVLKVEFARSLGIMAILILIIGAPFFFYIFNGIAHGALSFANKFNSIKAYMISSVPISSFFLPSPFNDLFSGLSRSYYSVYIDNPTERVAYLGLFVVLLVFFAVKSDSKKKFVNVSFWLISAVIFIYLSMGPYIQIGRYVGYGLSYIPGIYLLYSSIPIFNLVREPGRFDIIVTLSLAVLAAFGAKSIIEHYKKRYKTKRLALYATALIAFLILMEYNGIPLSSSFINSYFIHLNISSGYQMLANIPSNATIMILPTIPNIGDDPTVFHPQVYSGMSMYFQTEFQKKILGGYTSRINDTQQLPLFQIPISVYGSFLQRGINFQYTSPVSENYTNVTMYLLGKYNVSYVSVIKGAFSPSNSIILKNYLQAMFGNPIYEDNSTLIFSSGAAVSKTYLKSIVAYPSYGVWSSGCIGDPKCTTQLNTFWYGSNVRKISVFVPQNKTSMNINFSAVGFDGNTKLFVLINGNSSTFSYNLTKNITDVHIPITLQPGISGILFYSLPSSNPINNTHNFGIRKITFSSIQ